MKTFEDSDSTIREAFSQETMMPPASVWENVEKSLDEKTQILWYQNPYTLWSIAAMLVIGAFITFWALNRDENTPLQAINAVQITDVQTVPTESNDLENAATVADKSNSTDNFEAKAVSENEISNLESANASSTASSKTSSAKSLNEIIAGESGNQGATVVSKTNTSKSKSSAKHTSRRKPTIANVDLNSKNANEDEDQKTLTISSYPNSLFTIAKINAPTDKANSKVAKVTNSKSAKSDVASTSGVGVKAGTSSNSAAITANAQQSNSSLTSPVGSTTTSNSSTNDAQSAGESQEPLNTASAEMLASRANFSSVNTLDISATTKQLATPKVLTLRSQTNSLTCFSFTKKHKPNLFVSAHAAVGPAFRKFDTKSGENIAVLVAREQTETAWYSYELGGELGVRFHKGLAIKTGLLYNQIREKFDYFQDNFVFLSPEGDVKTGVRIIENTNRYTFVDIPLSVGYIAREGHWGWHGFVGAAYNVSFAAEGKVLSSAGNPMAIGDASNTVTFASNAGLSAHIQAGIDYYIGHRINLFLRPQFRMRFKDLSGSDNPISQEYKQLQLQIGLTYFP
ncbi:MAG: hypothetical protein ABIV51_14750 [Saprospiraceae bacterium]